MAKVDVISPGSEQSGNSVTKSNCDTTDASKLRYMISPWESSDGDWFGPGTPAGLSGNTVDITGWADLFDHENQNSDKKKWKSVILMQLDT